MTKNINLETVEAYLGSTVLPQGNLLPAPIVIVNDDTPLYDEPSMMEEMEKAMAEDRPAKINCEIINIENYSSTLITITFVSVNLEGTYRVNVPRQLVQVGYVYNRLLNAPVCGIVTESEAQMNKDFASEKLTGAFLPPWPSEDIMVRLFFPKDMSQETRLNYNYLLSNLETDYTDNISKEEIREIAPKVRLIVNEAENIAIRAEVIDILMGLVEGSEDALVTLYEIAEHVDTAKKALDKNGLLDDEERKAVISLEFIGQIVSYLHPENLVANVEALEDSKREDTSSEIDPSDLFGAEFAQSLNELVTEFRQENPDTVTITEESTKDERVEYLRLASNLVPLMGGLVSLSDRMNVDLYYSQNWNRDEVTEDEYGTRGEYIILLAVLAVQRVYMLAKALDIPTDSVQDMKSFCLSLTSEALTKERDNELWYLKEAFNRAARGDTKALLEFLIMSITEIPREYQINGPFGNLLHWLGHVMIDDENSRETMLKTFAKLPIMSEFVETVYDDYDSLDEELDDDEEEEEFDGQQEQCYVTNGCLYLPFIDGQANIDLAEEFTKALIAFAEMSLRRDDKNVKKGTVEWVDAMSIYLSRPLSEED